MYHGIIKFIAMYIINFLRRTHFIYKYNLGSSYNNEVSVGLKPMFQSLPII